LNVLPDCGVVLKNPGCGKKILQMQPVKSGFHGAAAPVYSAGSRHTNGFCRCLQGGPRRTRATYFGKQEST